MSGIFGQILAAGPAPPHLATGAAHRVAARRFKDLGTAAWTRTRIRLNGFPTEPADPAGHLAPSFVPFASTLPAHRCATFAEGLVGAAAWFGYSIATVRPWTPLEFFVLAHFYVLLLNVEQAEDVGRAERLHFLFCELLEASLLHTGHLVSLSTPN